MVILELHGRLSCKFRNYPLSGIGKRIMEFMEYIFVPSILKHGANVNAFLVNCPAILAPNNCSLV